MKWVIIMFKKEDIILLTFTFIISIFIYGCCRFCKVENTPTQIEEVPIPCKLPEGPGELPIPKRTDKCIDKHICYDIENAAKLAERDGKLKQWIREAKAKCEKKDD